MFQKPSAVHFAEIDGAIASFFELRGGRGVADGPFAVVKETT